MISWIITRLGVYLWPAIGAAFVALTLAVGVQTKRVTWAKADTQQVKDAWTLDKAQRTQVALDAATTYRKAEAAYQANVKEAQNEYATLQAQHAKSIVASRVALAESGKLRGEIAAYAAGSGYPSGDTCTPDRDRALALASLLAEALRVSAEGAADAETNADALRAVLAAWPAQ